MEDIVELKIERANINKFNSFIGNLFIEEEVLLIFPGVALSVHCKTDCIAQTTTCSTLSQADISSNPRTVSAGDSILRQWCEVFQTW